MDGFASKVRYSLAFLGGGVPAANAYVAGTIGDERSIAIAAGRFCVQAQL